MSALDRLIAGRAWRQHGQIATWQLTELGVGRTAIWRRVADRRLFEIHRGAYSLVPQPLPVRARWMAAVLAYGPRALLSHRAAGALMDLTAPGGRIHVTVPGCKRRRRPGIAFHDHDVEPFERTVIDSIPVTSLARTLLDLAGTERPLVLRRAYERAERLRLLDLSQIAAVIEAHPRRRGARRLARLMEYDPTVAAQAASELERLFLDVIREAGLPMPQVNVLVEGYLVDCYWPAHGLVVELDGYEFHSGRREFERDREKVSALQLAGLTVLPFTHRRLRRDRRGVVRAVARRLRIP